MKKLKKLKKHGQGIVMRASLAVLAFLSISLTSHSALAQSGDAGSEQVQTYGDASVEALPSPVVTMEPTVAAPTPMVASNTEPTRTSLDRLSSEILNVLIPTFVLLIGVLATAFLNWIRRKTKIDVSLKQIVSWGIVAELAAARGSEWVRNKTKDMTEGKTIPGPEILEVATNWAIDFGVANHLPEVGRAKLEGLIESKLQAKRLALIDEIE